MPAGGEGNLGEKGMRRLRGLKLRLWSGRSA